MEQSIPRSGYEENPSSYPRITEFGDGRERRTAPVSDGVYRFSLSCNFPEGACDASARVVLDIHGDAETSVNHPQSCGNFLTISCRQEGGLISASGATISRQGDHGYHWKLENANQTARLILGDRPFDLRGGSVEAILDVGDRTSTQGICTVSAKQIGDR